MIKIVLILRKNSILKVTVTKNSPTNMTGSTIITAKNLPREKTVGRVDETNKTISTVKTHTMGKTNNITISRFAVSMIKNLKPKKTNRR